MNTLFVAIASIVVLYAAGLLAQQIVRRRFCALCVSVSLTWLWLLVAYVSGRVDDALLIGILMGGSVVGLMYLLQRRLPERFSLFRLPYVVSMVAVVYVVLGGRTGGWTAVVALAALWVIFIAVYLFRAHGRVAGVAQKIIACCRDW
ncbi:MAG: hypothetical protein AAB633_01730 [Patescibacteria group bacterium]